MLGERGTRDSHKPHPDLVGPLPCGPGALSLLQFTKTAALTLAGGRWMDPWPKASCRMLVGRKRNPCWQLLLSRNRPSGIVGKPVVEAPMVSSNASGRT
ncbi:hypothetical protein NDU88_004201 [Pleurodeles waltl]|uniref:Uncharacterized protein n=1 Tax=Pleurodeles waltl TaxID=8319 RepID=A0AAV7WX12_PLEWA|nr:hypothetical protein NDU88_004201 [Pleurodeles waltl]